jgi:hypothetical protein
MNERNNHEPNHQQSLTEDLAVSETQAGEVKGGPTQGRGNFVLSTSTMPPSSASNGSGGGAGKVQMRNFSISANVNHNQTVAEDGVAEAAEFADLSVAVPQAEEVKGGVGRTAARWEQVITGDLPTTTA